MVEIHIGMIEGRHEIEDAPFTEYIWGEHLVDEGIMEWATFFNRNTEKEEKVLNLVNIFDASTHRRVAGEWITQTILRHPLMGNDIVANGYKVKVIFYITGGISQIQRDFLSSWLRLTDFNIPLEIHDFNFETEEYQGVNWP